MHRLTSSSAAGQSNQPTIPNNAVVPTVDLTEDELNTTAATGQQAEHNVSVSQSAQQSPVPSGDDEDMQDSSSSSDEEEYRRIECRDCEDFFDRDDITYDYGHPLCYSCREDRDNMSADSEESVDYSMMSAAEEPTQYGGLQPGELSAYDCTQKQVNYEHRCKLCEVHEISSACLPCGHFCCCQICYDRLTKFECPICRSPITDYKQIYF